MEIELVNRVSTDRKQVRKQTEKTTDIRQDPKRLEVTDVEAGDSGGKNSYRVARLHVEDDDDINTRRLLYF